MGFSDAQEMGRYKSIRTEITGEKYFPGMGKMPTVRPYLTDDFGQTLRDPTTNDVRYVKNRLPTYNPQNEYDFDIQNGEDFGVDDLSSTDQRPVNIANMDIPTSSSNVARPRTVAAGYYLYVGERARPYADQRGKLTVMFRDGTLYNYYDVPPGIWVQFRNSISKGPMLNRASSKQGSDGILLNYPNGPADISDVPEEFRNFIYRAAVDAQVRYQSTTRNRRVPLGKDANGNQHYRQAGRDPYDPTKRHKRGAVYGYVPTKARKQAQYSKGSITSRTVMGKNPNQK